MKKMPLIIANWKMKLLPNHAQKMCTGLVSFAKKRKKQSLVVCPSFESIAACAALIKKSRCGLHIGAQDCGWDTEGAYTGAVSALSLRQLGCTYCIIGHSERRTLFGETDEMIARKMSLLLKNTSITPILCVGETTEERKKGLQKRVVRRQIEKVFRGVPFVQGRKIIIAYEPIWAIGTGRACTPKECALMIDHCRKSLKKFSGHTSTIVVYGGSVTSKNIASFVAPAVSDGVLVGSASIDLKEFISLIKNSATL